MKQLLLVDFSVLLSGFLTAQNQEQKNLENTLKSNSKIKGFKFNPNHKTLSLLKIKPTNNLIQNNVSLGMYFLNINNDKSSTYKFIVK